MIEKDIFKALQGAFHMSALLQDVKLWSFDVEESLKPFVIFQGESTGENTALIHLKIESDYKGLIELAGLKKEIRVVLSLSPSQYAGYRYVFKEEQANQKRTTLIFKVKRFKTGE